MNRKETAKLLTKTLIATKLHDHKYFAREVTLDYGTNNPKRIDVVQYIPRGTIYSGDIENGTFICYEIKSCVEDVFSGHGLRFYGDENYIVTTMETYKKINSPNMQDKLREYLKENYPDSDKAFGFLVLVPEDLDCRKTQDLLDEYEKPSKLKADGNYKFWTALKSQTGHRKRSTVELLFCMLRAKHSTTNESFIN